MNVAPEKVRELRGTEVYDRHDEKVGKVGEVFIDNATGEPKWVTVNTGLFGTKESFVPLEGATGESGGLRVATDKKTIKDAPYAGDDMGELSERQERDLWSHYGLTASSGAGRGRGGAGDDADRVRGRDGRTPSDQAMTRSEESLRVGKESEEAGTVRLRKYVVTEDQTVNVPVSHEEVRLEREPVSDDARGGTISEDERSVTLHAERPVVDKETHAVEQVRLDSRTVTEDQAISDRVRKEQIEVDDPHGMTSQKGRTEADKPGRDGRRK